MSGTKQANIFFPVQEPTVWKVAGQSSGNEPATDLFKSAALNRGELYTP